MEFELPTWLNSDWLSIYPELVLLLATSVIAIFDLWIKGPKRQATLVLSSATLLVVAALFVYYALQDVQLRSWSGMIVNDNFGYWLKAFASIALMLTLIYGRDYSQQRDMLRGGEFFSLPMFAFLGMCVMISSGNILMLYVGLELLALPSYALVALRRDSLVATEAGIKYFVLGAMASGFLLYGLSMLYGATGSLDLQEIAKALAASKVNHQFLVFGLVFIVAGLAFKLGAVPFHMWVADVYQGAPTSITLFIAAAPKLAVFGMTIRLLVDGLLPLAIDWQQMLLVLATLSLLLGNLAAIAQSNIKRMLAFSTISQLGFVLLGLASGLAGSTVGNPLTVAANAYGASMFYIVVYVLTTLLLFAALLSLTNEGFESDAISDLAGLNQRSPFIAFMLALGLFSLAGIPPLAGFFAKFAVLKSLMNSGSTALLGLAIFAVMMSLIGAFYYLRVIKTMYFDAPLTVGQPSQSKSMKLAFVLNAAALFYLSIAPEGLLQLCNASMMQLLRN